MGYQGSGRKKTPTKILQLRGNPGHRPLGNEPKPSVPKNIVKVPKELIRTGKIHRIARREWKRIVNELFNLGLLTLIDIKSLIGYCMSYACWVDANDHIVLEGQVIINRKGDLRQNPYSQLSINYAKQMKMFLVEFGMTPASRSRMSVEKKKDEDEFAEFMNNK